MEAMHAPRTEDPSPPHPLEEQIRAQMQRAFHDALDQLSRKTAFDEKDVEWMAELLGEIVRRIKALIPRRVDLHAKIDAAIDVSLTRQMLLNSAFDGDDFNAIVNATYDTLGRLCAPSQDENVARVRRSLLVVAGAPRFDIGRYVMDTNRILDEIERFAALVGD